MGWASGGEIFDQVADSMIRVGVDSAQMTEVLADLIQALQDGDWDTEDESMYRYRNNVAVMDAFRKVDPEDTAEWELSQSEDDEEEEDEDPNEPGPNDDELPVMNHIQGICPGGTACTCDERDDRGVLE